jgi:hypothetical protein
VIGFANWCSVPPIREQSGCSLSRMDSGLILAHLRAKGYETSKTFAGADLVIVSAVALHGMAGSWCCSGGRNGRCVERSV